MCQLRIPSVRLADAPDRYAPLPQMAQKLPFLNTIQLPTLNTYLARLSGSLDAFETLSSAFVRAVPGALSGNARGGVHIDLSRTTGGVAGLEKLVKARLSAGWIELALRGWADDVVGSQAIQTCLPGTALTRRLVLHRDVA